MCLKGTRWLLPSRSPVPTTMMIVAVMVAIAVIASLMATSISNVIEGLRKMSSCLAIEGTNGATARVSPSTPRINPRGLSGQDGGRPVQWGGSGAVGASVADPSAGLPRGRTGRWPSDSEEAGACESPRSIR